MRREEGSACVVLGEFGGGAGAEEGGGSGCELLSAFAYDVCVFGVKAPCLHWASGKHVQTLFTAQ